jgi:hypothetical protein
MEGNDGHESEGQTFKKQRKYESATHSDESCDSKNLRHSSEILFLSPDQCLLNSLRSDDQGNGRTAVIEKKRAREQKRRSDITNAIDLLAQVLLQIDMSITNGSIPVPSSLFVGQVTNAAQGRTEPNDGAPGSRSVSLPYNRSEIISYAKDVLERIHHENVMLRMEIETLKSRLSTQAVCCEILRRLPLSTFLHHIPLFETTFFHRIERSHMLKGIPPSPKQLSPKHHHLNQCRVLG